ncbi:PCGF3-like protein [Mya arenaria]|uniref:PCGF3-like protein n=1 Tax=Mya arenaria TaxID=6604 RepID=A0ABY7FKG2_MYAAR|nr:PCGF3-like protein [Mya arenaria]
MMEKRAKLKKVNPEITCGLCKGYLVEATTITECLHTLELYVLELKLKDEVFSVCRSCLVKFLLENNTCPRCGDLIHQSHPLNYISHDRTMQDIVYKLVPNLQENERKRQIEFYKKRGIQMPNGDGEHLFGILKRRILRLSSLATVTHLKKFVALKVFDTIDRYKDVDILCNEELLGKDHMLKFIIATRWRNTRRDLYLHQLPSLDEKAVQKALTAAIATLSISFARRTASSGLELRNADASSPASL